MELRAALFSYHICLEGDKRNVYTGLTIYTTTT